MEIEIKEKKENKQVKRLEVTCNIVHSGGRTPSRDEVKKLIAKELGKNEELIAIEYVSSTYGKNESSVYAKIYDDKESMGVEKKYLFNRGKKQEA
jgi:ribosomal protein S24E